MRRRIQRTLARIIHALQPREDQSSTIRTLSQALAELSREDRDLYAEYVERASELIEARQMSGAGPWLVAESRGTINQPGRFRESNPLLSQGAFSDIELALQNVEWRREVNLSWLEFSRWGIQQIILISRLYYIKNPLIQRGINVAAHYVWGRGVEVSSPDEAANETLESFFERNKTTLGQIALSELEKRKYYDGNLFFAFFPDTQSTGDVNVRTIDATEIMDIVTDPGDTDKPWYYRRCWTERTFDPKTGATSTQQQEAWYPALNYEPEAEGRPQQINGHDVMWDNPVLHRKCGSVAKWNFGCPIVYAALDWAKTAKRYLESCYTVTKALAKIANTITTKGGQAALEGVKAQLQTTVAANSNIWDNNPPGPDASTFASGPGTKLEALRTRGAGGDPSEVKEYRNMVACVLGIPPTFMGDMDTSNLATATSLDRPTELNFLEKQEAWREDLLTIALYVLRVSNGATSGRLREAIGSRKMVFREAKRVQKRTGAGNFRTVMEAVKSDTAIEVAVNFPAIVEGDIPAMAGAIIDAMTLRNRGGQIVGIDEKEGVKALYRELGIENGDEIAETQYPEETYEPDRSKQVVQPPIGTKPPYDAGGKPQVGPGGVDPAPREAQVRHLARELVAAVIEARNGSRDTEHIHG